MRGKTVISFIASSLICFAVSRAVFSTSPVGGFGRAHLSAHAFGKWVTSFVCSRLGFRDGVLLRRTPCNGHTGAPRHSERLAAEGVTHVGAPAMAALNLWTTSMDAPFLV